MTENSLRSFSPRADARDNPARLLGPGASEEEYRATGFGGVFKKNGF